MSPTTPTQTITTRVPVKLWHRLRVAALKRHLTVQAAIADAISLWLAREVDRATRGE